MKCIVKKIAERVYPVFCYCRIHEVWYNRNKEMCIGGTVHESGFVKSKDII